MSIPLEDVSFTSIFKLRYLKTKISVENAYNYLGRKVRIAKEITSNALLELIEEVKKTMNEHYPILIFISCTLYTYNYSQLRFLFSAGAAFFLQDKRKNPQGPILSTFNYALNIIGALGLFLHRVSYPLSNPFFYLAPCLSGVAITKTAYALYRKYFPVEE